MASFRGHILNAAIRYAGKRRLADLEFTPAAIAASRARMDRLGDRVALSPALTRHTDDLGGVPTEWTRGNHPRARRDPLLPRRRLCRGFVRARTAAWPRVSRR